MRLCMKDVDCAEDGLLCVCMMDMGRGSAVIMLARYTITNTQHLECG